MDPKDGTVIRMDMCLSDESRLISVLTSVGYEINQRGLIDGLGNLRKLLAERGELTNRILLVTLSTFNYCYPRTPIQTIFIIG